MNTSLKLSVTVIATALMALSAANASVTKSEHKASAKQINATYKADKIACKQYTGNAKDVCVEEAIGKQKVSLANLEYSYTDKPADRVKAMNVLAESTYAIAKEKCDDKTGNDKDVCVKDAKAAEVTAKADTKMDKKIDAAQKDAAEDKRDADYKAAAEKCDALAGDAKKNCITSAKSANGK